MTENTTNNTQELSKKEKKAAYDRAYRNANKEKLAAQQAAWYRTTKSTRQSYHREWRKNNPGKTYKTKQESYKKDSTKKIKDLFRSAVYKAFYRIKQNKPTNTQTLLGCTWEEAKAHFESLFTQGMSWSNHGEWHVDHIRPVASFGPDELHIMNHISNLQPLWAKDNLIKGDRE